MSYNWEKPKSKRDRFLDKIKEIPKQSHLLIAILICVVIFGMIQVFIFQPTEVYLKSLSNIDGVSNLGVLELEFAWTEERITTIFSVWKSDGIFREFIITIVDFVYLICYCIVLAGLILLVARKLHDKFQKAELIMTLIPILAGTFDILENIFLLMMLGFNQSILPVFPLIVSISAIIKFILIYMSAICFLAGIVGILLYHYEVLEHED